MTNERQTTTDPKSDVTGEFFSVGTPLHAVRAGYVQRQADDELFQTLIAGGNAYVIAPDRSGKSSLIAATSARLQSHGVNVAVIDLAQIGERDGGTDAGRWYYNIAYRLLRQLRLKTDLQGWWQDKALVSNRQRLVEFYIEVVLHNIPERVVVFIDEIQCVENLPFAEDLLASVRAAYNSRATDPDFSRLGFVMLGECDPHSLVSHDGLSPFAVAKQIRLTDFSRKDLHIFRAELNLPPEDADIALDQIFDWTNGQPYLTQKLARSVAREMISGDVRGHVDRIAMQQLAGRAALHSEPHMSHIHRAVTTDRKDGEAMLNLYGKMRKGVTVIYQPESALHRKLLAIGLVVVGHGSTLQPRSKVYAAVFTARWANESLSIHWRGPAIAAIIMIAITAIPFWYTQLLPNPYVRILSSPDAELATVASAYENLRSFPGHANAADNLYRSQLQYRATRASEKREISRIRNFAARIPRSDNFAAGLVADYWDRILQLAQQQEHRDAALIATLESLVVSTPRRRRIAANLIGDDYPQLVGTVPHQQVDRVVYDAESNLLSFASGAQISQWSLSSNVIRQRATWTVSALEVTPLVRRLTIERGGSVRHISLDVRLAHARRDDIRMKLIAPSGRAVELEFGQSDLSTSAEIQFPRAVLSELLGEAVSGTWSLSLRDESAAVPGSLVTWSLTINEESYADILERALDIPDPVARESDDIWFSDDGRYAIARAAQSDSARVWDLLYAQPARTIAVPANERVLGLSSDAEYLVTVRQDSIILWQTNDGRRHSVLDIGPGSSELQLTDDGRYLQLLRRGDTETTIELWSIEEGRRTTAQSIAGSPSLIAVSADGRHLAVADYDRAVRIWDLREKSQIAQIDLVLQPTEIALSANGDSLGIVHGDQGISLWNLAQPGVPVLQEGGRADWQLTFSPSGTRFIAGNSFDGYQVYRSSDGAIAGPAIGSELNYGASKRIAFSNDESFLVTASSEGISRFWTAPSPVFNSPRYAGAHKLWRESGDSVSAIAPGGQRLAIGDSSGHVHILGAEANEEEFTDARDDISFIGHHATIAALKFSGDGSLVASAGADGAVKIWDARSGSPKPFRTAASNVAIDEMVFSPSGARLAVLAAQRVWIMNTDTGDIVADIELGESHVSITFANDTQVYLASAAGALKTLSADRAENWNLRTIWTGDAGLSRIAVSPSNQLMIVVDNLNRASLLNIASGQFGATVLQLPAAVSEIVFAPSETRALFRTARWVHRANISSLGLSWLDALRAPKILRGSKMVLDNGDDIDAGRDPLGGRVALLTRDRGFAEVAELQFSLSTGPTLIGPKKELLVGWREKLARDID